MHCSSLNQHLYSKNIVDSPLCQCGAIETTEHHLLHCPLYNVHRQLFIEPFLTIVWFHMIIIFLDRPSSVTNKTLKFSWQCNPLLSTRNELSIETTTCLLTYDTNSASAHFIFSLHHISFHYLISHITVCYYTKFNLS